VDRRARRGARARLALAGLRLGTNVVLDFGVWSREERCALKYLTAGAGAACALVYLPVGPDEQSAG
jgi:predicted kinase